MDARGILSALLLCTLLSGCFDSDPDGSGPSESAQDGQTGSPRAASIATFAWNGSTHASVCIPQGTQTCSGTSHEFGEDSWSGAVPPGSQVQIEVELTWDQRLPGLGELRVTLYATKDCGAGCIAFRLLASNDGPTPLRFASGMHKLEAGESGVLVLVADARPLADDPVLVDVAHPRAFYAHGTLLQR